MSDEHHSATEIPARLRLVIEEIALAAEGADRDPDETKLIAVSKTVPAAVIEEAIESGQRREGVR